MGGGLRHVRGATALGLLALLGWAASNALTRDLVTRLGPNTVLAVGFGGGGLVLALVESVRLRSFRALVAFPPRYLVTAGACFVGYCGAYAYGFSLAADDDQALVLGLVNYLWPAALLLLSLHFFNHRARWALLLPGLVVAGLGVVVAAVPSWAAIRSFAATPPLPVAIMLVAAVLWGLYSNLARRDSRPGDASGVPVFALATGLLFAVVRTAGGESSQWDPSVAAPLGFLAVFVSGLCYLFWDVGVRKGDLVLLGACSYGLPVAATLVSCAWLGRPLTAWLAAGSVLVAGGAVLCRLGIRP